MNTKKKFNWLHAVSCVTAAAAVFAFAMPQAEAQSKGKNGTTLAASKTLDICVVDENTWRYSGEVSVWNAGAVDTQGLNFVDTIQNNLDNGAGFVAAIDCSNFDPALQEIPAGTTLETATVFKYMCEASPLEGFIRNSVVVTILNHSGSLGTPKGPNPKATWTGGEPLACEQDCGCVLSHGFWKRHSWPAGFEHDPSEQFYFASKTICVDKCNGPPRDRVLQTLNLSWEDVLEPPGGVGGNGYFILAQQYVAAALNQASNACTPDGVLEVFAAATTWFSEDSNSPDQKCPNASSCGTQKTWAGILDSYNNGEYPGGPAHCGS